MFVNNFIHLITMVVPELFKSGTSNVDKNVIIEENAEENENGKSLNIKDEKDEHEKKNETNKNEEICENIVELIMNTLVSSILMILNQTLLNLFVFRS